MSFAFASMEAENQRKPPIFDGLEEHWQEWSFVMRAVRVLVHAEVRGHVVALCDCSGAFYQAPLKEERTFLEPPPVAQVPPDSVWEALCAFTQLKGGLQRRGKSTARRRWRSSGATTGSRSSCGRHRLLDEMEQTLQLSDTVRLFEDGDEGTCLSKGIRKIHGGYAQG